MTEVETQARPRRKQMVGRVVSDKMDKTVVVAVDYLRPHRLYRKTVRKTSKFYAHDEQNECRVGDWVRIEESRPLSRLKRWQVIQVVQRGTAAPIEVADESASAVEESEE